MKTRNMEMMTNTILLLFAAFIAGCNAQGEFYDKVFLKGAGERFNYCSIDTEGVDDPVSLCESSSSCQAMYDLNLNYLECIPVLTPNPADSTDDGDTSSGGDSGENDPVGEEEDETLEDSQNPGQEFLYLCENLMEGQEAELDENGSPIEEDNVLVCHFPNDDPSKAHTLCVGRPGWENGHSSHLLDHMGSCNELDF